MVVLWFMACSGLFGSKLPVLGPDLVVTSAEVRASGGWVVDLVTRFVFVVSLPVFEV